jgi:DNA ligase-1
LNGQSYLSKSYLERRQALQKIIKKNSQTLVLAKNEIVDNEQKVQIIFEQAVKDGLEGIMAKKLSSVYQAGARDWNWIKYKHSYSNKLADTVDCLVMGFDYGKGKRSGFGIGAFLVGVLNKEKNNFVTIAKIGTGLTDKEWQYIKSQSNSLIISQKPNNYNVNKINSCDVWLKPEIIVEIRADEVSKSPSHTAGFALRFPRLEKFRLDKGPTDITTLSELKTLYSLKQESYL